MNDLEVMQEILRLEEEIGSAQQGIERLSAKLSHLKPTEYFVLKDEAKRLRREKKEAQERALDDLAKLSQELGFCD